MGEGMKRLRKGVTFANVTSVVALFIALGGTSYAALTLPRNSVGSTQIRSRAVGPSELRTQAVSGRSVRDKSLTIKDVSPATRSALKGEQGAQGAQGPQGPAGNNGIVYWAAVNAGGRMVHGNAVASGGPVGVNEYTVYFPRQVDECVSTATLATIPGGIPEDPPAGRIRVAHSANTVIVRTYGVDGSQQGLPFNIIVAC